MEGSEESFSVISYNNISNDSNASTTSAPPAFGGYMDNVMEFDKHIDVNPAKETLGDLRKRLSNETGTDFNSLIISSHFGGSGYKFKNDNKLLSDYDIGVKIFQIYLEKGTRDLDNMYYDKFELFVEPKMKENIKIFGYLHLIELKLNKNYYQVIPDDIMLLITRFYEYGMNIINAKLIYLGSINLQSKWSMNMVKKEIFNKYHCTINHNKMRIRDFHDENKLTRIFYDDCDLNTNCKRIFDTACHDGIRICCQELLKVEYFTSNTILLNVSRVYALDRDASDPQHEEFNEISFESDLKMDDLRNELKEISNGMIQNAKDVYVLFMSQEEFEMINSKIGKLYNYDKSKWKPYSDILSRKCKTGDILLYRETPDMFANETEGILEDGQSNIRL